MGYLLNAANALGHNHNKVLFVGFLGFPYLRYNVLYRVLNLGHQNSGSSHGNAALQRKVARAPAHNLNNRAAVVRLGGVSYFINHFHGGIHSGIKAYGVFG